MSLQVWLPLNGDLHNQGLSGLTATNNGATVNNNGKIGKCYSFNGSQYIILPTSILSNFINEISVCAWVNITAWNSSYDSIIKMYAGNNAWNNAIFAMGRNNTASRLYFSIANGSNSTQNSCVLTTDQITNTWYHIACVYNYTDKNMKIYLNGELKVTYATTVVPNFSSVTSIGIGGSPLASYGLKGKLNDVRIYNHALSPKEVEEIAKGLVLHYKLDLPQSNLLKLGNIEQTGNSQNAHLLYYYYDFTGNLPTGTYTLSFDAKTNNGTDACYLSYANGSSTIQRVATLTNIPTTWTHYSFTFTNTSTTSNDIFFTSYKSYGSPTNSNNTGILYVKNVKLESGNRETPFNVAASETQILSTVYDSSGYSNNGTIVGSLTTTASSPRYDVATVFNGTNSTIKVMDNNWCSQGMEAMTINVWVKSTSWPTNVRIFSCTESGGFNTEGGSSGYYRFPVNVYTNAEKTSHAYKYDGQELQISSLSTTDWIMLTFVYDLTGTKTYINGELHHTYTNTSYGIYFNMNARLFLGCEANTANPSTPYFNGQQSDFRIYTTALTADQIKELYNTSMSIDSNGNVYARELVEL